MATDQDLYAPVRRRWTVVLASVASFMVGLDVLVTVTALPTLHVELGAGAAGLAWTINAYEIGFAALILTGTALGDRYGRRLLFVVGVGSSRRARCGARSAPASGTTLIVPLVVAGIGVATAFPTIATAVMRSADPTRLGVASGVSNTMRQVGAVFGVAVAVAVFSTFGGYRSPQQFVDGFGPTVMVLAAITLAGLVPAAVIRPRRSRPVRHPQEEAYETA
jgi:MFS family permease